MSMSVYKAVRNILQTVFLYRLHEVLRFYTRLREFLTFVLYDWAKPARHVRSFVVTEGD